MKIIIDEKNNKSNNDNNTDKYGTIIPNNFSNG